MEINLTFGLAGDGFSQLKRSVILAKVNTKPAEFPVLRIREYAALSQTIVIVSQDKQCKKLEISQGRGEQKRDGGRGG